MVTADRLASCRDAFDRHAWAEAYECLARADREAELAIDELERLATAAYLSGHDRQSTDAWIRAHRARLDAGDPERAVLSAFWLAFGLIQRGEMAEGGGWLARAGHLVDELRLDCVGCGYLLVPRGLVSIARGAHDEGARFFDEAGAIADRFHDADLRALSRIGRGQASFRAGRPVEGAGRFDEAMVSVVSGELSPVVAGIAYCAVVDECQQAFDVRRARAWTTALTRWCDEQPGLVPYRGQCLVHRSQVLQLHGAWEDALEEARRARERLAQPPHPAIGMAHYQLGELQRLRGDLDDAEASYLRAQELGRPPQPGLALVRLAQGEVDAAAAAIDAAASGAGDAVSRAQLLPAFVEIMVAAGRIDRAREGADELGTVARRGDSAYLDAAASESAGTVALAEGDPRAALTHLRRAGSAWQQLEIPYEAARTRVRIAAACDALGDRETARLERESAHRTFAQLGASDALARLDDPADDADRAADTTADTSDPLSPREIQVLRRVAGGMTNRAIADDLFISVKTVERHLSNVFVKLDVPNRTAATTVAHDAGLLDHST